MVRLASVAVAFLGLLAATPLSAGEVRLPQHDPAPRYMRIYGPANPPYGFVQFCDHTPSECAAVRPDDRRVDATPAHLAELDEINRAVNRAVQPATDMEIYGVTEYWTIPKDRGDCEDYALLKRQLLVKRGWPVSSLLMTVVRDEKGEGHAILTARTSVGDYILDNKVEDVKLWSRTGYRFIMRQSYVDPKLWVSLDPKDAPSPAAIAGVRGAR